MPRRRILVVDDHSDSAEALSELLAGLGHDVRTAGDGPTALEVNDEWHPEIIFLDIGLPPGMDGYEVARAIRRGNPDVPQLVALTGYGQDSARQRSKEAGFAQHILKPPHLETIVAVLDSFGTADPTPVH